MVTPDRVREWREREWKNGEREIESHTNTSPNFDSFSKFPFSWKSEWREREREKKKFKNLKFKKFLKI